MQTMQMANSATGVRWDLSDLYTSADDPQIDADLQAASAAAEAFSRRYRAQISTPDASARTDRRQPRAPDTPTNGGPSASLVLEAVRELERVYETVGKLASYSSLLSASDTSNPAYRQLDDRVRRALVDISNEVRFFELQWLALPDEAARQVLADPALENYRHYLDAARRYKPHTLSEAEEKIWAQKSLTSRTAWRKLFDELTASLVFDLQVDGQVQRLTQSEVLAKLYEPDRELRRRAAEALFAELARHELVLSHVFNALLEDHGIHDRVRHYSDPMESRHLDNEVSPQTVARMLEVTESNYAIAHDYYRLKARLLGLERLYTYDQYAPLFSDAPKYSYDRAQEVVLEAFGRFTPQFRRIAAEFFERAWIDAEVRPHKRSGAFCASTVPSVHPYILLNWTERIRDVATLAHELGHGLHQYLSRRQTYFNFDHPLTTAETASVFAEFLVFYHLLEHETDPRVRLALLCAKIEDTFATVFRQTVLTRFEQVAHQARRRGPLEGEAIGALWLDANRPLYADAVEMPGSYRWGWSYIPHFIHTPFYCYAYVFGELLVLSLYRMYQEEGASFVPRYIELLSSGSREAPDVLLRRAGADISDPEFWQKGFFVIRDLVHQAVAASQDAITR